MSTVILSISAVRSRRFPRWNEVEAAFTEWRQRARTRRHLMALSDRDLWDMGLTRMDADNEAGKPFWES
jgi:uncharacterized protein YjiS (DUF1127 family)